jgi:hypothetical protein
MYGGLQLTWACPGFVGNAECVPDFVALILESGGVGADEVWEAATVAGKLGAEATPLVAESALTAAVGFGAVGGASALGRGAA